MSETEEVAKAVQEVSKATSALVANRRLGEFVARTVGEPVEAIMGIITDRLQFMRWKRYTRLVDKTAAVMDDRNLHGKTRVVPPKFALPIIENASLEEDDFLQDMWINLLISAMDSQKEIPRTAYIDIIKVLTPMDAQILKYLYDRFAPRRNLVPDPHHFPGIGTIDNPPESQKMVEGFTSPSAMPLERQEIMKDLGYSDIESFEVAIDNLARMGCATLYRNAQPPFVAQLEFKISNYDKICITSLGVGFVDACMIS